MELFIITLSLLCVIQSYVIFNLYKKYDKLENIYETLLKKSEEDVEFIFSMRNRVMSQKSYLRQLDKNGSFESDDEIGYFFEELKKIINDISIYFEIENEENEENKTFNQNKNIRSVIVGRG